MHYTPSFSPFEVVYGFNPLTPMDLAVSKLPSSFVCDVDGAHKAQYVKDLHVRVQENIQKRNEHNARVANRGRKEMIFNPDDSVWVHFRKIRFPDKVKSKHAPQGVGPFQVKKRINNNAYVIDLQGEYNVSSTLNVSDLCPFDRAKDESDLRTNPSQDGGDDADHSTHHAMQELHQPMTRDATRRRQEAISTLLRKLLLEGKNRGPGNGKMKNVIGVEAQPGSSSQGRAERGWRIASFDP